MAQINKAFHHLNKKPQAISGQSHLPFRNYLDLLAQNPLLHIRNVFQVFHDMVQSKVEGGIDEYQGDPESIHYVKWDFEKLFVEGMDNPFFADRLFGNRFMRMVETMRRGSQQNKIYLFEGPHGSGKSTFLNNVLNQFEQYANTPEGLRYETVWHVDRAALDTLMKHETLAGVERLLDLLDSPETDKVELLKAHDALNRSEDYLEIACPSHDHPLMQVPKEVRRNFLDELLSNDEIKWTLFTEKEYEWVFKSTPCTICTSIYNALLQAVQSPERVMDMLYVRPYRFSRRLGEGISVFSPGDQPPSKATLTNEVLQGRIDHLLQDSNRVRYLFSRFAKTNHGVYALMDIKGHNTDRLYQLHNILSDGVHKVDDIEESVNSLFLALINPEDKEKLDRFASLSDRVQEIKMPYILDIATEVQIYRNTFGRHIDTHFLPKVLHNFARVIVSSRMNINSPAMLEWIHDPVKYRMYCDDHLQLLKMEIYTGHIPPWLYEHDRKRLNAHRRRKIIDESLVDGNKGFSGRDSITLFNEFYTSCKAENGLISMDSLRHYFTVERKDLLEMIPDGLLDAVQRHYDYALLQDIKEALYDYNEDQIGREIQNYLFAVNFEEGQSETCPYTGDKLTLNEEFFEAIESKLLGMFFSCASRRSFRHETQRTYASTTLTQEILGQGLTLPQTRLFQQLHDRYVHNLKERVLEPFVRNENFRRAIKDYNRKAFSTYDRKIQEDVTFLMNNLQDRFRYTAKGAKEVCMYAIDNDLAHKYSQEAGGRREN